MAPRVAPSGLYRRLLPAESAPGQPWCISSWPDRVPLLQPVLNLAERLFELGEIRLIEKGDY